MAKRTRHSTQRLGSLGIEPVTMTVIGVGVIGIPLLIGLLGKKGGGGGGGGGGGSTGPSKAQLDAAAAAQADALFASALSAANGIVAGAVSPAALVYTGPASAAVGVAWSRTSTADKASIWRTGGKESAGAIAAGSAFAPRQQQQQQQPGAPTSDSGLADLDGAIPQGAENLVKWIVAQLRAQLRAIGQFACANIDNAIKKLKNAGAKIPDMSGWSCDQKVAFVAAITPWGLALVVTGALTGALASNAAKEVERNLERAKSAVSALSQKLGIKVPSFKIGGTAGAVARSVGIGGYHPIGRLNIE